MGERNSSKAWMLFCFIGLISLPDVHSAGEAGPCDSFPCGPVGACFVDASKAGGYGCVCDQGFERPSGEGPCVDVDECAGPVNPCGPYGTCVNQLGFYECNCTDGYVSTSVGGMGSSLQCIKQNDACKSNPCGPAGTCNPQPDGTYLCECVPGYKVKVPNGPCEEVADPCYGNPCGGGGICNAVLGGGYHCTCLPGYVLPPQFAQYGGRCYAQDSYVPQFRAQSQH
eukprot:TRINITY_DN7551_c0_g1_i2.p1 TRINITY_DN7551_c0_g1~~TRINITY_DN7551_c0_g1_i2.p1  ORF type:complete len:226 (-),score=16.25 TRINITY_DN7551_c0_g1_i2:590-1267(-)